MHYKTALRAHRSEKLALVRMQQQFLIPLQPVLINSINKKIRAVYAIFNPEKNFQTYLVPGFLCNFIPPAILLHPFFPRQIAGDGRVAVEEMICNENPIISRRFMRPRHFIRRGAGARASLFCMQMRFVFIHFCHLSLSVHQCASNHVLPVFASTVSGTASFTAFCISSESIAAAFSAAASGASTMSSS